MQCSNAAGLKIASECRKSSFASCIGAAHSCYLSAGVGSVRLNFTFLLQMKETYNYVIILIGFCKKIKRTYSEKVDTSAFSSV